MGLRMTDLIGKVTDVNQTLAYSGQKMGKQFLRLGVVAVVVCGVWIWLGPNNSFDWMAAAAGVALGIPLTIYGLVKWLAPPTPLDQGGRSRAMFGRQRVRLRSFPPLGDPLLEVREFVLDGQTTPATSFCGNVLGYARVFGERVSDRCGSRSRRIARPRSSLERA